MKEIPPVQDIRSAIEEYEQKHLSEFYERNMNRITDILNQFIEDPGQIGKTNNVWFYLYEYGRSELKSERKHMFTKELNTILDNLNEKGYNCKLGKRISYKIGRGATVVSLEIDFNKTAKNTKGFFERLFSKNK